MDYQKFVAAGANLSSQNGAYLNELTTGLHKVILKRTVKNAWGENDKTEVLKIVDKFIENKFDYVNLIYNARLDASRNIEGSIKHQLALNKEEYNISNEEEFDDYCLELQDNYHEIISIENRLREDDLLRDSMKLKTLKGYNLSRVINLARWYYDLQVLSKEEALSIINKAYSLLHSAFDSWQELSVNYIGGRVLWFKDFGDFYDTQVYTQKELLKNENSPWVNIKW